MVSMEIVHVPVLREEVGAFLSVRDGLVVDATLGEGGHSEALLESHPGIRLLGVDADPIMLSRAGERLSRFGDRVRLVQGWFDEVLESFPAEDRPVGILMDLGISSYHLEKSGRGFSFLRREPLDMRLSPYLPMKASDVVNTYSETELVDVFSRFGEEPFSRRIARAIVSERRKMPITTSDHLAEVVMKAVPPKARRGRIHPATRVFQALRIVVNKELERVERAVRAGVRLLAPGGRMAVISFHSLEDRIVKRLFRFYASACTCPPEEPICRCGGQGIVEVLTKKPVRPGEEEVRTNPASRSARLRVLEKVRDAAHLREEGHALP
ncbi:Ribosomal RNA small subunit methyltransferase H [Spirochaeta thermophila DSM 6578]|uniref:Ribosomal RNA small subunit methyltransferase H n=2 Tax=Winmispira thermophila TaxID=154 RepID=G0GCA6_WINT7|nr:Ribosomal RNA small subunit methyltransferase H [Spirochaeta thermophila DSM 6578]